MADRGFEHADYVLSGLPFSTLPPGVGPKIAEETAEALRPGGAFLVYQFSPKVRDYISPHFDRIDKGFEWINIPPAKLFWAWKRSEEHTSELQSQMRISEDVFCLRNKIQARN